MVRELEAACIPRSVRQLAAALRKASGEGEGAAAEWEARVEGTLAEGALRDPRIRHGDGLLWLQ